MERCPKQSCRPLSSPAITESERRWRANTNRCEIDFVGLFSCFFEFVVLCRAFVVVRHNKVIDTAINDTEVEPRRQGCLQTNYLRSSFHVLAYEKPSFLPSSQVNKHRREAFLTWRCEIHLITLIEFQRNNHFMPSITPTKTPSTIQPPFSSRLSSTLACRREPRRYFFVLYAVAYDRSFAPLHHHYI